MERKRQRQKLVIFMLMFSIASLSIGFAAFSATLNISSSASVTPNSDTFSVKFSVSANELTVSPVAPSGVTANVAATNGVINNSTNPTISNLSASFTAPGQYVMYTFYARNMGEYTAYLNSVNFLGEKVCTSASGNANELVQSACEDVTIFTTIATGSYMDTTSITGHSLAPNLSDRIQVVINYESDAVRADEAFTVKFPDIALVYSTVDDPTIEPTVRKLINVESGNINTPGSIVSIGDEQFYVMGQENGNVKLLSMYNLLVGGITIPSTLSYSPISSPTGIQDSSARGYIVEENTAIGTTEFAANSYDTYENSTIKNYVDNYKAYLVNLGANVASARLITIEELDDLGCQSASSTCEQAPTWLYLTTYWTASIQANNYGIIDMYVVNSTGKMGSITTNTPYSSGVRPVIEIPISEF